MKPQDYTIVFSGAGSREIQARGRFLRIMEAATADVFVKLDGSKEMQRGEGSEIADSDPKGFSRVAIRSAVAQTVRFSVSDLPQADNRQTVSVNATAQVEGATEIVNTTAVVVGAGATVQILAGDTDRLQARIALLSTADGPVFLGATGVTDADGGPLEPGSTDYMDGEMAIYAHNPGASAVTVYVTPLRRP